MSNFKNYANSFQAVAKLRLESIRCLLDYLGNPQTSLKFIHVAGTNGKGSVCSFLQNIFTASGICTGKYTSPNLISVCERISIDGRLIAESELSAIMDQVEKCVKSVEKDLGEAPTQFEIWTAAAFLYFKAQNCDLVILETGLGGSRDATNIIPLPLASVITRLDLDHTEYLGSTLKEIATEKAGIIKYARDGQSGLCITSPQPTEALEVLKDVCEKQNNKLIVADAPISKGTEGFCEIIDYKSSSTDIKISDITCGISGFYQMENAALAIETALALGVSPVNIKKGIEAAKNPGRFEVIRQNPTVIYDGAHNKNGMSALVSSLNRYFPQWDGATFITAFMGDKDMKGALNILKASGLMEKSTMFAVSVKDNPRGALPQTLSAVASEVGISTVPFPSVKEAYLKALSLKKPVILCGSLYLYKDFAEIKDQV